MTPYFHYHVHIIHEIFYVNLGIGFGIFGISHFGYEYVDDHPITDLMATEAHT